MRDRHGLVRLALLSNSVRPVIHGQMCPVVIALLQLLPGLLQNLLPRLVAKQRPKRCGGDLHTIIMILDYPPISAIRKKRYGMGGVLRPT